MQRYATIHTAMFGVRLPGPERQQSSASPGSEPVSTSVSPRKPMKQQVHWAFDGHISVLAFVGPEYELYALFDTMTDKESAMRICHRLSVWIKAQQADFFMPF